MIAALILALSLQILDDSAAAKLADAAAQGVSLAEYERTQSAAEAAALAARTAADAAAAREDEDEADDTPGQDIEWAATVAQANALLRIPTRAGLTEAQRDTCAQIADRIGSWQLQRVQHRATQAEAEELRRGMAERVDYEQESATPALLDLVSIISHEAVREGDRAGHALMSAHLVFCRPL